MPGFVSRDDIITEITTNGKVDLWNFLKTAPSAAQAAGSWQSLWTGAGNPGAGANPAATPGTVYDSDTVTPVAGSIYFADRLADLRFGLSFGAVATQNCTLMLYDRLAGVSGVALNAVGAKTVNSGALTRYSGAAATLNEAWLEITTATTTTAAVVNLNSYTSADGTAAQAGGNVTLPAAATVVTTMIQLPLAPAKQGVRSVEAGLNVGTAAAAGAANLIIIRPLARIGLIANIWNEVSLLDDVMDLPRIFDNATLGLALLATVTTAVTVQGKISCAYG
jgi:hypothetical protein